MGSERITTCSSTVQDLTSTLVYCLCPYSPILPVTARYVFINVEQLTDKPFPFSVELSLVDLIHLRFWVMWLKLVVMWPPWRGDWSPWWAETVVRRAIFADGLPRGTAYARRRASRRGFCWRGTYAGQCWRRTTCFLISIGYHGSTDSNLLLPCLNHLPLFQDDLIVFPGLREDGLFLFLWAADWKHSENVRPYLTGRG